MLNVSILMTGILLAGIPMSAFAGEWESWQGGGRICKGEGTCTYQNARFGFSVDLPVGTIIHESENGDGIRAIPHFDSNFDLRVYASHELPNISSPVCKSADSLALDSQTPAGEETKLYLSQGASGLCLENYAVKNKIVFQAVVQDLTPVRNHNHGGALLDIIRSLELP